MDQLTQKQEKALEELIRRGRGAPSASELPRRLEAHIERGLNGIPVEGISLNKQALKVAEQCPGRLDAHLRREGDWVMTTEFAVGRVLHRAAEVDAGSRELLPIYDVVDHAITRLVEDLYHPDFEEFWTPADELTRADVRGGAVASAEVVYERPDGR